MKRNVMAEIREVILGQRQWMMDTEINGLKRTIAVTNTILNWAKSLLKSERRKARRMARLTQDWNNARMAYKTAYILHDKRGYELQHAVAELEQDLKTLESRLNPTAAQYPAHPWNVDVDVYIYDESDATEASDISDAEVDAYVEAIKKCLRGEFAIETGSPGDRGFGFWADDADWDTLNQLLGGLESRGCIVEYPDWDYIHETDNDEEN